MCISILNVKKFLEKGLFEDLVDLLLLSVDDGIKKEVVFCLNKVCYMFFVNVIIYGYYLLLWNKLMLLWDICVCLFYFWLVNVLKWLYEN